LTGRENEVRAVIDDSVVAFARDVRRELSDAQLRQVAMSGPADNFAGAWNGIPSYVHLAMALTHDPEIRSLLKPEGREAPILFSLLAGTELYARKAPAGLLAGALFELLVDNLPWTEEAIREGLLRNIDRLRQVVKGKPIESAWAAGLAGFSLMAEANLETQLGRFAPVNDRADLVSRPESPASVIVTGRLKHRIPVDYRRGKTPPGSDPVAIEQAGDRLILIRIAVILAVHPSKQVSPVVTLQTVGAPHLGWMGGFRRPGELGVLSILELNPEEADELARWTELLSKLYRPSIHVALDRLATAVSERWNPSDMLIDAVTSWENLFGATPETTFRLTASLAVLLEADHARRADLRKRLDEVYRVRSRVVHGENVERALVSSAAEEAIEISKAAVRTILENEPWLLSLKTSRERSDAVLLGDPRLHASPRR
jgi:Apea-like HEPN